VLHIEEHAKTLEGYRSNWKLEASNWLDHHLRKNIGHFHMQRKRRSLQ